MHGLGEHCHRYDRMIQYLTEKGYRIHAFDHRGHGRTHNHLEAGKQGHCGHIDSDVEVIMEDISELIKRDESAAPKYLLGHSLGGLMVIYYAMTKDVQLNGLITICRIKAGDFTLPFSLFLYVLAPAIGISRPPNIILRKLAPVAAQIIPTFTIESDIRLHDISRLPEVQKSLQEDILIHRKISFGTGNVVLEILAAVEGKGECEIKIPTLFIHGTADKITE